MFYNSGRDDVGIDSGPTSLMELKNNDKKDLISHSNNDSIGQPHDVDPAILKAMHPNGKFN